MSCVDINASDNDLITSEVFHKFAFPLFNARQPSGEGNVFSLCVYMSVCSPFTGPWPCASPLPSPLYRAPPSPIVQGPQPYSILFGAYFATQGPNCPGSRIKPPFYQTTPSEHVQSSLTLTSTQPQSKHVQTYSLRSPNGRQVGGCL